MRKLLSTSALGIFALLTGCGPSQSEIVHDNITAQQRDILAVQLAAEKQLHNQGLVRHRDREDQLVAQLKEQSKLLAEQAPLRDAAPAPPMDPAIAQGREVLFDRLSSALSGPIAAGQVTVTLRDQRVTVAIDDDVLFQRDGKRLSAVGQGIVGMVGRVLIDIRRPLRVSAHAPAGGKAARASWAIAGAKARAVADELNDRGVSRSRIDLGTDVHAMPAGEKATSPRVTEIIFDPTPDEVPPGLRAFRESRG